MTQNTFIKRRRFRNQSFTRHTSQKQNIYKTNWPKGSASVQLTSTTVGTTPNVWSNHRFRVFWKKWFFHFLEPKKVIVCVYFGPQNFFLDSHTFFALLNSSFSGFTLLVFWIWALVLGTFLAKCTQKIFSDTKMQEIWHPQNHNFRGQKR